MLSAVQGPELGVNLGFLMVIGWVTLAVYILNKLTSIVKNMLVLGYEGPETLVQGLTATRSTVDAAGNKLIPKADETAGKSE